jgi:peptidyl-prolyl cis-trans isomerase D
MLKSIQQRDLDRNRWIKISMTVILVLICVSMVITLIPGLMGGGSTVNKPDAVATVGGEDITIAEVRRQISQMTRGKDVPEMLRATYAQEVIDQMIFQRALEFEAGRLGLSVTPDEETDRIKQLLPTAWSGGVWQKDRYATEVMMQTGMSVGEFESMLRDAMIREKFGHLVTNGITVSPAEIDQEFRRRNEKVTIQYALVKPADLAPSIHATDAELAAYFAKYSARYPVPEKRTARYALLDLAALRSRTEVGEDALRVYYKDHLNDYRVEDRAHVERILFMTIGKTDAEVAEIRKKAEDVLNKAKHGGNFEDLAKKYSEDQKSKAKGGDIGWIVPGQTDPAFQQVAFGLPKGAVSDLVKTQLGFDIVKVLDRETAHIKSLEEVRSTLVPTLLDAKVNAEASDIAGRMAAGVRLSNRQSLDALAKQFQLELGETSPTGITEPVGTLGNSPDLHQALFELQTGELSQPMRVESGYVILTVKDVLPAHQGTLVEVHSRVLADYQQEKSLELARSRTAELSKRAQAGEAFDKAAKSLGIDVKTSESFAETGSVPDVGTGQQLSAAFGMAVGQVSGPAQISGNWLVYRIVAHDPAKPEDLANQTEDIRQRVLESKQTAAFAAFRADLISRLTREGQLSINAAAVKTLAGSS